MVCTVRHFPCSTQAIVRGDTSIPAISAASIPAKVTRDAIMVDMDALYPVYGFAQHKGYPTKAHRLAIQQYGLCHIHRLSFSSQKTARYFRTTPPNET